MLPRPRVVPPLLLLALCVLARPLAAQETKKFEPNYDESKVPDYTLPDPLVLNDGTPVKNAQTWTEKRRPEVLGLFETHVYGKSPGRPEGLRFETLSVDKEALGGKATRKQVRVHFADGPDAPAMDLLIYVPNDEKGPHPAFLGLNFGGNQTIRVNVARSEEEAALQASGKTIQQLQAEAEAAAEFDIQELFDDIGSAAGDDSAPHEA